VFESIKGQPTTTPGWLFPILISCLVAIIHVNVIFSQPAIIQTIKERQEEQIQQMIQKGTLTKEQAAKAEEQMASYMGPTFLKITGSFDAVINVFLYTFLTGIGVWLVGTKAIGGQFEFMKAVEIAALAGMIGILGAIVTMLLIVAKGNAMVNLGPMLLLEHFDAKNKTHQMLASINLMNFWYLAVLGLGLSRVANDRVIRGIAWVFGIWAVLRVAIVFSGLGQSGL
jgi:hypothetical protein